MGRFKDAHDLIEDIINGYSIIGVESSIRINANGGGSDWHSGGGILQKMFGCLGSNNSKTIYVLNNSKQQSTNWKTILSNLQKLRKDGTGRLQDTDRTNNAPSKSNSYNAGSKAENQAASEREEIIKNIEVLEKWQ